MAGHRFAAGDRVKVLPDRNSDLRPGIYTITRILPVTSQGCEYRAKNVMDSHERVLNEAQLQSL